MTSETLISYHPRESAITPGLSVRTQPVIPLHKKLIAPNAELSKLPFLQSITRLQKVPCILISLNLLRRKMPMRISCTISSWVYEVSSRSSLATGKGNLDNSGKRCKMTFRDQNPPTVFPQEAKMNT